MDSTGSMDSGDERRRGGGEQPGCSTGHRGHETSPDDE